MYQQQRGYTTTVELSDDKFWQLYYKLDYLWNEFQKAFATSVNHTIPSKLSIDGYEYSSDEIYEAVGHLKEYIEKTGVSSRDYDLEQVRLEKIFSNETDPSEALDLMFVSKNQQFQPSQVHKPAMEFKIWEYVLPIIGAFEETQHDQCNESNDWSPPMNFQNGTRDEREVWAASEKNQNR